MARIKKIIGREVLNSKALPTIEAEVILTNGISAISSVPSGSSKGTFEARELLDGGNRFWGKGVLTAVSHISTTINNALAGLQVEDFNFLDQSLLILDDTPDKRRLGGNTMLAVSQALLKACAMNVGKPVYRFLKPNDELSIPNIASTIISGGKYSGSGLDFEDYILMLSGFPNFIDQIEALCKIRVALKEILLKNFTYVPEDNGVFCPALVSSEKAFDYILDAARIAGYGNQATIGLDVAANNFFNQDRGAYLLANSEIGATELTELYVKMVSQYPITYIEDPFEENAFGDFSELRTRLSDIQIVGDDLLVTNLARLQKAVEFKSVNTLLFKVNQVGTVSEAIRTADYASKNEITITSSLRAAETNDDIQADLAVAVGARQMKLGAPERGERNAKYNRLLRIEEELR